MIHSLLRAKDSSASKHCRFWQLPIPTVLQRFNVHGDKRASGDSNNMGCVLCKNSAGAKGEPPPGNLRRDTKTDHLPSSVSVPEVVDIGERKKSQIQTARTWHTGDFSGGSSRRTLRMSLSAPEGWPPWLLAACGESIKDFTPRRATTYEKLDKVNPFALN